MAQIQTAWMPMNGPSWDEEVVPALRKRLESESRTLAKRMSAVSLSSQDESHSPNIAMLVDTQASAPNSPFLQSNASSVRSRTVLQEPRTSSDRIIPASSRANGSTTPSKKKPPSRSRTYSQPYIADLPNGKTSGAPRSKPSTNGSTNGKTTPDPARSFSPRPNDIKPTRIPKAAPRPSTSNTSHSSSSSPSPPPPIPNGTSNTYTDSYPYISQSSDLHTVSETLSVNSSRSNVAITPGRPNPGLLHEPAPFQPGSVTSIAPSRLDTDDLAPPRASTDSEERPFEHWYRGEVSRNGGVGELRVGRRQEMLEIANYGHTLRTKLMLSARAGTPAGGAGIAVDDGRRRRKRADSVSGIEAVVRERERESLHLDEDDVREVGRVLDESPLTDLDGEEEGSDAGSASEHYMDAHRNYSFASGAADMSTASTPMPRTSYDNRSTTPTSFRPSSRQTNAPPSRIPAPPSRMSSESRVVSPTPQTIQRGASEPPSMPSTSTTSPSTRRRQPSKPTPVTPAGEKRGVSPAAKKTPSRTTAAQKTRAKKLASRREVEEEDKRRSVAYYPTPADGEELVDAIPSWTQPVPRQGNWDDVVLPVVARKKGLDGHYEKADGNPTPRKVSNAIEPAPGTFGFDHSKYRPPRAGDPEYIPMDEFGRPTTRIAEEPPQDQAPTTNAHDETRLPVRHPPPPSPAPFSDYAPSGEKVVSIPMLAVGEQGRQGQGEEEYEPSGGCCKCVIM
ncbi:hypothetical protein Hypma_014324 [Hypsizygus marmoreus]|uniref:Uncharacterized protein n=1 Tax=Hypsizygus marmoreus TaxID=39966 RepID=A0A369JCY8_HYPMA|nr:hypothetical protein Hypma_014324 [Hypsizygus marmoreus]